MFKILAGPSLNLLGRGAGYGLSATGPECSAAMDASYPLANLYDGRPATPGRLAAASTGFYVRFPNNLVSNGDFEQSFLPGWTASSATLTSETGAGYFHKGAKSMKVVTSSAGGGAYQDITVRAGEYLQLWAAIRSDGSNAARVTVRLLDTYQDLNSSGAWAAYGTFAMTRTTATMAAITPVTFQVPSFNTLGKATATVRILLTGAANAQTCYFDEVLVVPGINFAGVFGHGSIGSGAGLTLATSGASYWHSASASDDFGAANNAAFARQAAHILKTTMLYEPFPYVRVHPGAAYGTYTSLAAPWIGELVVGQVADLARNPDYPVAIEYREPNVRMATAAGSQWVLPRGAAPTRKVTLSFAYASEAQYVDARDNLMGMSRAGAYPVVLIPTETDSGEAIFGRLEDSTTFRRDNLVQRIAEFIVVEEAFPWV
jgi:hypothetical protein